MFSVGEGCKLCMRYTVLAKIWSNIAERVVSVCHPLPTPPLNVDEVGDVFIEGIPEI